MLPTVAARSSLEIVVHKQSLGLIGRVFLYVDFTFLSCKGDTGNNVTMAR